MEQFLIYLILGVLLLRAYTTPAFHFLPVMFGALLNRDVVIAENVSITSLKVALVGSVFILFLQAFQKKLPPARFKVSTVQPILLLFLLLICGLIASILSGGLDVSVFVAFLSNLFLIFYASIVFNLILPNQYKRVFSVFVPIVVIGALIHILLVSSNVAIDHAGGTFYQGNRLRSSEERNIINLWAATLALWLPLLVAGLGQGRLRDSLLPGCAIALTVFSIVMTFSRAALFSVVGAVFVILPLIVIAGGSTALRFLRTVAAMALIVVALTFVLTVRDDTAIIYAWLERIRYLTIDKSVELRLGAVAPAIELFDQKFLLGGGFGRFLADGRPVENTLLDIMLQFGFIGIAFFLTFLASVFRLIIRHSVRFKSIGSLVQVQIFATYLFLMMTNELLYFSSASLMFGLLLSGVLAREDRSIGQVLK